MKAVIRSILISAIVLAAPLGALAQSTALDQPAYVPGEVLVKFVSTLDATAQSLINDEIGTEVLSEIPEAGVFRLHSRRGDSTPTLVAKYLANPFIEYAEPNYYYYLQTTPNDPKFTCQWGLDNWGAQGGTVGIDIQAKSAWNITTGTGVIVAVLDTGVDTAHADLVPNLLTGYNFVSPGDPPTDTAGHGTHVAGIIGGKGNNAPALPESTGAPASCP